MDLQPRGQIELARHQTASGCYSKAFESYMLAFEKYDHIRNIYELEFRDVLSRLSEVLCTADKMEEIFVNYSRVLKCFPNNVYIINDIGRYLFKYRFYEHAWSHFQKAVKLDSYFVNAEKNFNSLKNILVHRWHFRMLNDKIRNEAYRAAIHETLIPFRDTVLDIGTGTGLLSMYAHERKPMALTACDGNEVMAKIANSVTLENGCDQMMVLNKLSIGMNYLDIGGKRSLLLTELFDAGLFGEHALQSIINAWEQFLNSDGRVVPNRAEFFVIGANSDFLTRRYQVCSATKSLLMIPTINVHGEIFQETYDSEDVHLFGDDIKYITDPQSVMKVNFNNYYEMKDIINRTEPYNVQLKAQESDEINVFIGYFNLYLTEKVTVTTDPRSDKRANAWQQAVFYDNIPKQVQENEIIDLKFLFNGGKLTLLPEGDNPIVRISLDILRFLNDTEYIKMISGCIGMACVYLGQITEISQVNIIDLCPFPIFGLQMLKRGAQSLTCCASTNNDKRFFKKVFKANDIPLSKVTILVGDDLFQDDFRGEKYHVIFCNIFEICGEYDFPYKELSEHLKQNHLMEGGLFMPANIKIIGQIVKSNWLDINNRLYDENVSNFKIAKHINIFKVTQNFNIDFCHLEYTPLSEPWVMGTTRSSIGAKVVNVPIIKDGNPTAILCWYIIELMEDLSEISTNRRNCFIDGTVFLTDPKICLKRGQLARIVRCVDSEGAFKLLLEET